MTYIEIEDTSIVSHILDIYKKKLSPFINGGYFSGSASAMRKYSKVYRKVVYQLFIIYVHLLNVIQLFIPINLNFILPYFIYNFI